MEFIDLKKQYRQYKEKMDKRIEENIESASFILGKDVRLLEEKLADYVSVKHAIGCSSGTDALLIALLAYDLKSGDEILTTPFTFIATAEVISFVGAKPVFVDIDENNYNVDPEKIEAKITERTKGIIPVSLYGQVPDMDRINKIAQKHRLFVVEDAAQSFGAVYKGKKSCGLTDIGATSFFPSKPLGGYGDGGMIFTDNEILAEKMRSLANHGQAQRYVHKYVGLNSRLDTIQAGVLLVKFEYFETEAEKRFKLGRKYSEMFAGSQVITPKIEDYTDRCVYAQYSIRLKNREAVISHLQKQGIPTAVHYPIPIHLQEAYQYLGYRAGDYPVSEKTAAEIMSLPMHPFLSSEEMEQIVKAVKEAIK